MKLTYPEWERYAQDLKTHERRMLDREPDPMDFEDNDSYVKARYEWEQALFMDAPNKP